MQTANYLNKVILCLKKHGIECTPTGAPNPKTGDWYNYKLAGKNKMFHRTKACDNYTIKLEKRCTSVDAANAIIETVTMRFAHSNHDEAKHIIHELYDLKAKYNANPGLIYGIVD